MTLPSDLKTEDLVLEVNAAIDLDQALREGLVTAVTRYPPIWNEWPDRPYILSAQGWLRFGSPNHPLQVEAGYRVPVPRFSLDDSYRAAELLNRPFYTADEYYQNLQLQMIALARSMAEET